MNQMNQMNQNCMSPVCEMSPNEQNERNEPNERNKFILYGKEMQNHLFEFNLHCGFQESKRSIPNSPSSMSDVPIQPKILTSSL